MTFLLIGTVCCQLLSEEVKSRISYPKSEPWGRNIPSWAYSMVYAAEIFQLYKNNSIVVFSADNFFNKLKEYMNNNADNADIPHQECFANFSDNYNPECAAFFAKNSNYTFSARLDNTNIDIILKNYEVLDLETYTDLQDALNVYPVLYNGIYYDKTISNTGLIYEYGKKDIINDYNSTCLVVGTFDTGYSVCSEIIHPYSIYSGSNPYFIQTIVSFGDDRNNIKIEDYNHLYSKSIGLTFEYIDQNEKSDLVNGDYKTETIALGVNKGYKAATIALGVILGIFVVTGSVFTILCTKFRHLFKHEENEKATV